MSEGISSVEEAFIRLSNPEDPQWAAAFAYLAAHPETAPVVLETFRETLEQMGVEPSGLDPVTGEPAYGLKDVARAMGLPVAELERSMEAPDGPV